MKKNIFRGFLLTAVSVAGLTSCMQDSGNFFTLNNAMCTVVSTSATQTVVQMDATQGYYYADEFLTKKMQIGDRYLLQRLTVNYDEQPAGATGQITSPLLLTEVASEKVSVKVETSETEEELKLANDSLELFYPPYINHSKTSLATHTYITFSGAVYKKSDSNFRLVYKGRIPDSNNQGKDTLCYDFKMNYTKAGENDAYDPYVQCFMLGQIPSDQIVKISYTSKRYQDTGANKMTNSYCIIQAPTVTATQTPTK